VDDLLREFLAETGENLARLDQDVVELERAPSDTELLNSIFRTVHTIKGTCGFLGLVRLEGISHAAESVLDLLRSHTLAVSPAIISDILRAVDVIRSILAGLERDGVEPAGDDSEVAVALERWTVSSSVEADQRPPAAPSGCNEPPAEPPAEATLRNPIVTGGETSTPDAPAAAPAGALRVNVALLDKLMNLAGELVLTRNQLRQLVGPDERSPYVAAVRHLDRVTADLQDAVMRTRMQPVGTAWNKLPRIVRDIASDTGKRIELEMHGGETELDRQLVQALQDPLTHMVRNSADHGIELPALRRAAGKPESGTISLSAFHEAGHVIVEIHDDGAGIAVDAVRRRAVEHGLISGAAAAALSDQQLLRLVFEPGFSTAVRVTHLSGRGVGMDVVRDSVERVGGTVELRSLPGAGTTVRLRLPLTLAIVAALLVTAGEAAYAIPQSSVIELVRLGNGAPLQREVLHGTALVRLRGGLLPLVDLRAMFDSADGVDRDAGTVVVCEAGDARFGVLVDEVLDTQEIVVKPVGRRLRQLGCYAGCTILGDGRVIMILDAAGIAARAGVREREARVGPAVGGPVTATQSLLLFDGGTGALQAVPLSAVARLEEIPASRIESADGRYLAQYRGTLLPIIPAGSGVSVTSGQSRSVIVFNDGATSFGLAVNEIRDIVEDTLELELAPSRPDVLGTAVVGGCAVEVLDARYFFMHAATRRIRS